MRNRHSKGNRRFIAAHRARLLATLTAALALLIPLAPTSAGAAPLLDLGELVGALGIGEPSGDTAASSQAEFVEGELLVRFDPTSNASERAQVRSRQGLQKVSDLPLPGLELVRIPGSQRAPDHARNVASERSVRYAEPNFIASTAQVPNDTYFSYLWGLDNTGQTILNVVGLADADLDGPEAWEFGSSSTPVVAVVDSGADLSHPDLAANRWINPGESAPRPPTASTTMATASSTTCTAGTSSTATTPCSTPTRSPTARTWRAPSPRCGATA